MSGEVSGPKLDSLSPSLLLHRASDSNVKAFSLSSIIIIIIIFLRQRLTPSPILECSVQSWLTDTSASQVLMPQVPKCGTTGVHHHVQLIFVFLIEMRVHHISQAGLKLLTSSDPLPHPPKVVGLQA